MLSPDAILVTVLSTIMLAAICPGPSFVMVSRISIAGSRVQGLAAAFGVGLGGTVFAALALAGVMALLTEFAWFHVALGVFGGASLLCIATQLWLSAPDPITDRDAKPASSIARSFGVAFIAHLSNPKVIAGYASIFAAVLPPVIPTKFFVSLPIGIFLIEVGWYSIVALVFSSERAQVVYLDAKMWIDRLAGGFLGCLGFFLIEGAVTGDL